MCTVLGKKCYHSAASRDVSGAVSPIVYYFVSEELTVIR